MPAVAPVRAASGPGQALLASSRLPRERLDELFVLLLFTIAGVFVLGNLAVLDAEALRASARVTSVAACLACLVHAAARRTHSLLTGLVVAYLLLLAVTFARSWAMDLLFFALAAAAAVEVVRKVRVRALPRAVIAGLLAATAIEGTRHAYTSFDMASRLQAGQVHQDPLFHVAIAAMIKNYGVVSTGLHGLVATPYHALSHALMAGISRLSATPVLEVYGVANWVFFAPVLVLALAAPALLLAAGSASVPLLWALAAVVLALANRLLEPWAFFESYLDSESYLLSLGLLLLALPLLLRQRLQWRHVAGVVLLTVLIAHAKLSVGLVFAGLWLVRALFLAERRRVAAVAAVLSLACAGWIVLGPASAMAGRAGLDPLHFIRVYSPLGAPLARMQLAFELGAPVPIPTLLLAAAVVGSFVVLHFLPAWLVAGCAARELGLRRVLQAPIALYALAAVGVGLVVVGFMHIPGGSAYYFSSIAFFLALPPLLARAASALGRRGMELRPWHGLAALALLPVLVQQSDRVAHAWPPRKSGPLLAELARLRETAPRNVVLRAGPADLAGSPVERCTARPFVFPAVAERPWLDVIEPQPSGRCAYVSYMYEQYRLSGDRQQVTVAPVLLPGMTIEPMARALAAAGAASSAR